MKRSGIVRKVREKNRAGQLSHSTFLILSRIISPVAILLADFPHSNVLLCSD